MGTAREILSVGALPAKYDRIYKARDRESEAIYEVNLARLQCTCPEFRAERAAFAPDDARRVCVHLYDKLYSTKAEREMSLIVQLFIRYGRRMLSYRLVEDDLGKFAIGQPFGPNSIRAIGTIDGQPVLATYDLKDREWASGETDLAPDVREAVLQRMRSVMPAACV